MPKLRFLCGCSSALLNVPVENRLGVIDTFDGVSFDAEGFIVCSIHHQRRYGWKAPSPSGARGTHYMTDIEFQQREIFGIEPRRQSYPLVPNRTPDLRPRVPSHGDVSRSIEQARHAVAMRPTNGKVSDGNDYLRNLRVQEERIQEEARR